ncbi:nucleotide-binding alpha-beta plait domain-containing protein [Tanacetum coccineum]
MKGSVNVDKTKNESNKRKFDGSHKNVENTVIGKSFVSVVKTSRMPIDKESPPAIVLEDDCLNAKDLTLSLMGRVKEMASLVNLKKALCNEGFDVVKISYLGELWVLLEFETAKAKDSFRGNVGVGSWFSVIKQAYAEFVPEGRLVWVELDGVPFKFWSGPTFKRIAAKWGELLDVDDYDESNLHSKRICILSKVCEHIHESFKIVFRGKVYWVCASEVLGWTPEFSEEEEEDESSLEDNNDGRINDLEANNGIDESDVEEVLETLFDQPDDQKDKHSEDPFGLYPLLNKENIELARKVTEEDHSLVSIRSYHSVGYIGNTVNLEHEGLRKNERMTIRSVYLEDGFLERRAPVNKINGHPKLHGLLEMTVVHNYGNSQQDSSSGGLELFSELLQRFPNNVHILLEMAKFWDNIWHQEQGVIHDTTLFLDKKNLNEKAIGVANVYIKRHWWDKTSLETSKGRKETLCRIQGDVKQRVGKALRPKKVLQSALIPRTWLPVGAALAMAELHNSELRRR